MRSWFRRASEFRTLVDIINRHFDAPPPYSGRNHDGKQLAVQVCPPPQNAEFEPVERQRHFGILRYMVNNRFRKIMLLGILNVLLIIGVLLTMIFVVFNNHGSSAVITTTNTTTKATSTTTTITLLPVTTKVTNSAISATTTTTPSTAITAITTITAPSTTIKTTTTPSTTITRMSPLATTTVLTSSTTQRTPTTTNSRTTTPPIPKTTKTLPTTNVPSISSQPSITTTEISTPSPTTTKNVEPDSCTPFDKTTFLFAYSNDFEPSVVLGVLDSISNFGSTHYSNYSSVRFDVSEEENFTYDSSWIGIQFDVQSHLPNPSLSFDNSSFGSDVLKIINRFLDNPVCGSTIFILVKRLPNTSDYSQLVTNLRLHHSYVTFLVSSEPSGGNSPELLFDLASKTNGICGFNKDADMKDAASYFGVSINPYLVYAVNPQVSWRGTIQLPPLTLSQRAPYAGYWITVVTQDIEISSNSAETTLLKFTKRDESENRLGKTADVIYGKLSGNRFFDSYPLDVGVYDIQLDYSYQDISLRNVQIRVQSYNVVDYWPPYND
ncbi:unnamed protein product [Caenorhabditis brenneri]